jgi:hypothetical protein
MGTKFTAILALLALCLTAATVFAEVKSFPKFKVNVPAGWETSQEGPTVGLVAKDQSASISITVDDMQGKALKDLAAAMSQELKGSAPQANPEGGYEFTFKQGEVESSVFISADDNGKQYYMIVVTGENPQIAEILNSLEEK